MKKVISVFLALLLLLSVLFLFSGCSWEGIKVTSQLIIDGSFSGSRTVSFTIPQSVYSEQLDKNIRSAAPVSQDDSVTLEVSSNNNGDRTYTLSLFFYSQKEYTYKVENILGRDVSVNLARPDNVMAKGTRLTEDFDTTELLNWLEPVLYDDDKAFAMALECNGVTVKIDGSEYSTSSSININSIDGQPIEAIKIYTKNNKDGTFDRTFTILMDTQVYRSVGNAINLFFEGATITDLADSFRWTEEDKLQQYQVVYTGLDMQQLQNVTNSMFRVSDIDIAYGDTDNSSTPFIEGLAFDEKINMNAYLGPDKGDIQLTYEYVLPDETTHGTATVLSKGIWEEQGEWTGNLFTLQYSGNIVNVSIKDGIEFPVEKIEYSLEQLGEDNYRRMTEIYYRIDEESEFSGAEYACSYFVSKGADARTRTDGDFEVCSLSLKGSAIELSLAEAELFGGGNYFSQSVSNPTLDLRTMTEIRDYIYIAPLLTEMNKEIPVYYTVKPGEDYDYIVNYLSGTGCDEAVKNSDGSFTVTIKDGISDIYVVQSVPHWGKIVIYAVFSLLMTAAAVLILRGLYRKGKHLEAQARKRGEEEEQEFIRVSQLSAVQKGRSLLKKTGKKLKSKGSEISASRKKKQADMRKKRELDYFNDELYDEDLGDDF